MQTKEVLELKMIGDFNEMTIRGHLHGLLSTLWEEGEGFSSKRPYGNSGWEFDLYVPLIKAGVVDGRLDEYGYIEEVDTPTANRVIFECIDYCFEI